MRTVQLILLLVFFISCRSSLEAMPEPAVAISKAEHEQGLNLVVESDCLTCHQESGNALGPTYLQIAKKYAATKPNINKLALKIITGGAGNWGKVPMTPHDDLQKSDAILMVKYILTVKDFKQTNSSSNN